jgi:hypothetical protein
MDKDASQTEKRPSRPADKPDSRQSEMDARYQAGLVWRNSVRTEDVEWRKAMRKEDKEWREVVRREDLEWRAEVRSEDNQHRLRTERIAKRCAALAAAAQTSKVDSSLDAILALARQFEDWLNSQDK